MGAGVEETVTKKGRSLIETDKVEREACEGLHGIDGYLVCCWVFVHHSRNHANSRASPWGFGIFLKVSSARKGFFDFMTQEKAAPGYVGSDLSALTGAAGIIGVKRIFKQLSVMGRALFWG